MSSYTFIQTRVWVLRPRVVSLRHTPKAAASVPLNIASRSNFQGKISIGGRSFTGGVCRSLVVWKNRNVQRNFKGRSQVVDMVAEEATTGPPTSKQEAISQAQTALLVFLSQANKKITFTGNKKKKNNKQQAVTTNSGAVIEIPLRDYSAQENSELVKSMIGELDIPSVVYFGDSTGLDAFTALGCSDVLARPLASVGPNEVVPVNTQLIFVAAPNQDQLQSIRVLSTKSTCPVVILNAEWNPHDVPGGMRSFVNSFEVIYSHMPLAIQGFVSTSEGAIFRCVSSGAASSAPWYIYWNNENISSHKTRPLPEQLEEVLYNKAAKDSPLVKAAGFFGNAKEKLFGGNK